MWNIAYLKYGSPDLPAAEITNRLKSTMPILLKVISAHLLTHSHIPTHYNKPSAASDTAISNILRVVREVGRRTPASRSSRRTITTTTLWPVGAGNRFFPPLHRQSVLQEGVYT